jgi:hypothetical protein
MHKCAHHLVLNSFCPPNLLVAVHRGFPCTNAQGQCTHRKSPPVALLILPSSRMISYSPCALLTTCCSLASKHIKMHQNAPQPPQSSAAAPLQPAELLGAAQYYNVTILGQPGGARGRVSIGHHARDRYQNPK